MLQNAFTSVIDKNEITIGDFLLCSAISLLLGLVVALVSMIRNKKSKSMFITIALLPMIVQVVIMIVNGNIGIGLAVAGAFSLVRYRSNPGTAAEILILFLSMAVGLVTGTGYILLAVVFAVVVLAAYTVYNLIGLGGDEPVGKELKITIPESLNYSELFDDIFEKYTKSNKLVRVRTTNLGSMYQLYYHIDMKADVNEKDMIDDIRCRNGNLDIICGLTPDNADVHTL